MTNNPITVRALCKSCMQEQFQEQKYDGRKVPMWTAAIERAISNRLKRELSVGEVSYKVKSAICEKGQPMPKYTLEEGEIFSTYDSDSLTCYCWVFLSIPSSPISSKQPEKMPLQMVSPPIIVMPSPRQSPVVESLQDAAEMEEPEPVSEEGSSFWFNPLSVVPAVTIPTIDPNPLSWFSGIGGTTDTEPIVSSSSNSIITMTTTTAQEQEPTKNTEIDKDNTAESNQAESTSRLDESKGGRRKGKTKPVWDIRTAETIAAGVSAKRGQFVLSGSADDDPPPSPGDAPVAPEKKPAKKWPTVQTGASRALPSKPVSTSSPSQNNTTTIGGVSEEDVVVPVVAGVCAATDVPTTVIEADEAAAVAAKIVQESGEEERRGVVGTAVAPSSPALSAAAAAVAVSEHHDSYLATESDWLKPQPQPSPNDAAPGRLDLSPPTPLSGTYYPGGGASSHTLGSPMPTTTTTGSASAFAAALVSPAAQGEQWPPRPTTELYPAHTLFHPYGRYEHSLLHPSETSSASASARASPTFLQPFQLQHTVLPPSALPAVYANPAYEHLQAHYHQSNPPQSNPPPSSHAPATHSSYDYDYRPVYSGRRWPP